MRASSTLTLAVLFCLVGSSSLFANDPPAGGLLVPILGSPLSSGSGPSATFLDAPWADRLNPSASAAQQRPVLDLGYGFLSDFSGQGVGTAINLGANLPEPYGVWGFGLSFLSTPDTMTDLPLGTLFRLRGGIAKDLYPNFFLGAAVDGAIGWKAADFGWGLGLDLGLMHKLGDLGFLKDFRYGAVLSGLGKGYSTAGQALGWPAPFTLSGGARALLVRSDAIKLGFGLDLSFPSFRDMGFGVSGSLVVMDTITLRVGWSFPSLAELVTTPTTTKSLLPSVGLMGSFSLGGSKEESFISKQGWDRSELRPALSFAPLYGKVMQLSGGLTLPLGVVDKEGPAIDASFPTTSWGPWYLSPNADGKFDSLDIPVTITDRRYVASWVMKVVPAGAGDTATALRSIANKESRPETEGLAEFWRRLTYVKTGVPVPDQLSWNGFGDGGDKVPDGDYEVWIEAKDDNGNFSKAGPFAVVVDATAPSATMAPAGAATSTAGAATSPAATGPDDSLIFSPDGDGRKDTITIKLAGSKEDLWTLRVLDAAGTPIRSAEFRDAAPSDFTWDGKNDGGSIVPDGVYSISLSSTDRAGNSFAKRLDNIIVNTQQPPVNIAIDAPAFSPNGDGVLDTITLIPSVPVRTGLVSWRLSVVDKDGKERFGTGVEGSSTDAAKIPERLAFDGKGADGKVLPEGSYRARIAVTYSNGHSPSMLSPAFVLDVTKPVATVAADREAFNPAGSEAQNRVTIAQTGSEEERWTGEILAADGSVKRTWTWNSKPEAALVWDGTDDAGASIPDGAYSYRLSSTDRAGNAFVSTPRPIAIDTEKKTARLVADLRAFSPNGDGVKDKLTLSDSVTGSDRVLDWKLGIYPATETGQRVDQVKAVKSWAGTAPIPATFSWSGERDEGTKAADGRYVALLEARYPNRDSIEAQTLSLVLDTVAPSISASAAPLLFSPNEESSLKTTTITQKAVPGDDWEGRLVDSGGQVVRNWSWHDQVETIVWDGSDDAGNKVRDGSYRYEVSSTDAAGNVGKAVIPAIGVDARRPQVAVTASATGLSPNKDGIQDSLVLSIDVTLKDGISAWKLAILDAQGAEKLVKTGTGTDLPTKFEWDGKNASGAIVEGTYKARLAVSYLNGNNPVATSPSFVLDLTAPVATVKADRVAFNPAGDDRQNRVTFTQTGSEEDRWTGEILAANGKVLRTWTWKPIPEANLRWDGTDDAGAAVPDGDYRYRLRATDRGGNAFVSAPLPVALDTEKKTARLVADLRAFSPNGDGQKDTVNLTDTVQGNLRAASWKLGLYAAPEAGQQLDRSKSLKTWTGTGAPPASFVWAGIRDDGTKAPDGRHIALLELRWPNGDVAEAQTLPIVLDTTPPSIALSAAPLLFSPNEQSLLRTTTISQKAVPGDDWEGRLLDSSGAVIRSWSWKGQVADIVWNATDTAGNLVKDGSYRYEVSSTDAAGNATKAIVPAIVVDARAVQVFVTASATGLSPNGDGVMDDINFSLIVNLREGIASWRFSLVDASGAEAASFSGAGADMPARLTWNGKNSAGGIVEGNYTGIFRVDYAKGDRVEAKTGTLAVDVTGPVVELALSPPYFSPDNDGVDDELSMSLAVKDASELAGWKLEIDEASIEETPGAAPKERLFASWSGTGIPASLITWDGKSTKGELVESATDYPLYLDVADIYGNKTRVKGIVAVDVLVIREGDRLKIKVPSIVFRANFADFVGLDPDTVAKNQKVIGRIAEILNKFKDYRIAIEGHANSIGKIYGYTAAKITDEEQKELVPLSTNRADLVRKMLVTAGVDARRLTVLGRGSSEPVVDFKDAVNRWKNRRVEFILIKTASPAAGSGG